jgi:hypothetical protein
MVPIHDLARVSRKHPAHLYVAATSKPARPALIGEYLLSVAGPARLTVEGFLAPRLTAAAGHQYLDLAPRPATVIVSVGEYAASWWERVDA